MKKVGLALVLVAAAAVLLGVAGTSSAHREPAAPPDTYVTSGDAVGSQAFTAAALSPPEGFVIFAYLAIAVYDSVSAIDGSYRAFENDVDAPAGASAEAAVAAAAHRILVRYLPNQAATIIDPAYTASLALIPNGPAKDNGIDVGEEVAGLLITQRADDGFRAPVTYTPPNPPIPGVWLPTAPTPPLGTYLPFIRTFSIGSADRYRPDGPPALGSERWARDYNEVEEIGSSASTTRTSQQTLAARFWGEPPVQQARGALRKFVLDHELGITDSARFMAMVSVVEADSIIACFDAKYHYRFWRPITAVRAGDTDDNDKTVGDPAWSPLLPATPNHPEYPSAHSCVTPAGGRAIARFLGTKKIDFTVPSLTGLGDRHFERVRDLQYEVGNARIWGGIHYRSSVKDGIAIGKRVANQVLSHHFQRSHD
jgi:hypothetical protein